MQDSLNSYCKGCDQFSAPHRRRDDGQWVCEDCGHLVECSDPQWSDNCDGDLTTPHEITKGLCEGCMAVIDSWSDDGDDDGGAEQTKLVTDGGKQLGTLCDVDSCENRIVGLDDGWEFSRGTVCQDCIDYQDRHGHWPDDDAKICVQCRIDDGAIDHDCDEFSGDGVLLQPGSVCDYCGFEAAKGGDQDV